MIRPRLNAPRTIAALIVLSSAAVPEANATCPQRYEFAPVAETGALFSSLDPEPALSELGLVAFRAGLVAGGSAIYTGTGIDDLQPMALDRDADPGSDLVNLGRPLAGDGGVGQAAFFAGLLDGNGQVWPAWLRADRATVGADRVLVATQLDPRSPYQDFSPWGALLDNGSVLTRATRGSVSVVARAQNPSLVVESFIGTAGGLGAGQPDGARRGGTFAFASVDGGPDFNQVIMRSLTGSTAEIRRADGVQVTGLGEPTMSEGGAVAYWESYRPQPTSTQSQFRLHRHMPTGKIDVLADTATTTLDDRSLPWRGRRGCVGFRALREGTSGLREALLYAGKRIGGQPTLTTLIERSDPLLDGAVLDLDAGNRGGNQAGQLAFWARIITGPGPTQQREVIVLATPIEIHASDFEAVEQDILPDDW